MNKRTELLIERSTKHGHAGRSGKSPTYLIWSSMIGRCTRPSDSSYKWYGAKGVTVCERWHKFENFLEDMGEAPEGSHIHRSNGSSIYSKETCEWLSESEHIGLHNQERGWGARLTRAQLIDRCAALQKELAAANKDKERWRLACNNKSSHDRILELEQQLAAERQKREQSDLREVETEERLLQAQAAIAEHNYKTMHEQCTVIDVDLSALDKLKEEVRKRLVEELENIVNCDLAGMRKDFGADADRQFREWAQNRARHALAKGGLSPKETKS